MIRYLCTILFLIFIGPLLTFAAPPILTNLVVTPMILEIGSGVQTVEISVNVGDPDGNLDREKVKARLRFGDGTKEKVVLVDDGTGRFAGQVEIGTAVTQGIAVKVKAKDLAKEKAVPLKTSVVVRDDDLIPTEIIAEQADVVGNVGETVTLSARVVNRENGEIGIPNWPVTFTLTEGDGVIFGSQLNSLSQQGKAQERASGPQIAIGETSVTIFTDAAGFANLAFRIGDEPLNLVEATASDILDPVNFRIITLGAPIDIAVEADGSLVVLDDAIDGIVRIDPTTGDRVIVTSPQLEVGSGPDIAVTSISNSVSSLAIEEDGSLLMLGSAGVARVSPVTGNRSIVSSDTRGDGPSINWPAANGLTVEANGSLIVTTSDLMVRVNRDTGDRTIISGCRGRDCDPIGRGPDFGILGDVVAADDALLVVESVNGTVIRVDPMTGDRSVLSGCINNVAGCDAVIGTGPEVRSQAHAMTVQPDRALAVVSNWRRAIVRVDLRTGDRKLVSGCVDPPLDV